MAARTGAPARRHWSAHPDAVRWPSFCGLPHLFPDSFGIRPTPVGVEVFLDALRVLLADAPGQDQRERPRYPLEALAQGKARHPPQTDGDGDAPPRLDGNER